jgi:hypothetical protein
MMALCIPTDVDRICGHVGNRGQVGRNGGHDVRKSGSGSRWRRCRAANCPWYVYALTDRLRGHERRGAGRSTLCRAPIADQAGGRVRTEGRCRRSIAKRSTGLRRSDGPAKGAVMLRVTSHGLHAPVGPIEEARRKAGPVHTTLRASCVLTQLPAPLTLPRIRSIILWWNDSARAIRFCRIVLTTAFWSGLNVS